MRNAVAVFFVVVSVAIVIMSVGCPAEKDEKTETVEAGTLKQPTSSFELVGPDPADIVSKTLPSYPEWAAEEGLAKVRVTVSFSIDTDGNVQPTMVFRTSSGNRDWDRQVQEALKKWKFTEAEELRKAEITFWFVVPVEPETGGKPEKIELAAGDPHTFELVGINPADIVSKTLPPYPTWAEAKGFSRVRITISFSVDKDGNVLPTMVVKTSSGDSDWDKEAQEVLKKWKFTESEELRKGKITFWFVLE